MDEHPHDTEKVNEQYDTEKVNEQYDTTCVHQKTTITDDKKYAMNVTWSISYQEESLHITPFAPTSVGRQESRDIEPLRGCSDATSLADTIFQDTVLRSYTGNKNPR